MVYKHCTPRYEENCEKVTLPHWSAQYVQITRCIDNIYRLSSQYAVGQSATYKVLTTLFYQHVTATTDNAAHSPPLVLGGASDKSPVDTDRLAHHVLTVEPFHGCLGLFVCLILDQSIPLGTVIRTPCELLHIYGNTALAFGNNSQLQHTKQSYWSLNT